MYQDLARCCDFGSCSFFHLVSECGLNVFCVLGTQRKEWAELNIRVERWSERIGKSKQVALQNNVYSMIPLNEIYICMLCSHLRKNVEKAAHLMVIRAYLWGRYWEVKCQARGGIFPLYFSALCCLRFIQQTSLLLQNVVKTLLHNTWDFSWKSKKK